jgi:hypothetical protein
MMYSRVKNAVPASIYRALVDFLASNPSPAQVAAFRPTPEMQERLVTLLTRSQAGDLTPAEQAELDEFERIEHLVILLKAGSLPFQGAQLIGLTAEGRTTIQLLRLNSEERLAERQRLIENSQYGVP